MRTGDTRIIRQNAEYIAEIGRLDQTGYEPGELEKYSSRITTVSNEFEVLFEDSDNKYFLLRRRLVAKFDELVQIGHP